MLTDGGCEAVAIYQDLRPDIVMLDITMPEMNGLEAMRRIFAADPSARVILCSAIGQQNLIVEAIAEGVKDFIVKPFKPERLAAAVAKAMALKKTVCLDVTCAYRLMGRGRCRPPSSP